MRLFLASVVAVLTLLYPLAVYFGIHYWAPWKIAITLFTLLMLRLILSQTVKQWNYWLLLMGLAYCGLAVWNNNLITLRFYPVLMNMGLFVVFFLSLFFPPSIIERLARLQHPDLPEHGVIYTRRVTQVWCVFFILNGLISVVTAVWSTFAWWSLYNGVIAYVLMGLLMGIEYLIRIRTQPHVR